MLFRSEEITCVVENEPRQEIVACQFAKGESEDDDPEVVEKGKTDDRRPVVGETTARVEDEGEMRAATVRSVQVEFLESSFDILFACLAQLTGLTDEIA